MIEFNIEHCRICFSGEDIIDLCESKDESNSTNFSDLLLYIIPEIDWSPNAIYPSRICRACAEQIVLFTDFKLQCIQKNILREKFISENAIEFKHNVNVEQSPVGNDLLEEHNYSKSVGEPVVKSEEVDDVTKEIPQVSSNDPVNKTKVEIKREAEENLNNYKLSCFKCDQSFKKLSGFKMHYTKVHKKIATSLDRKQPRLKERSEALKSWFCKQCKAQLHTLRGYNNHMKIYHSLNVNYNCDLCKKMFYSRRSLQRHRSMHKGGRTDYVCDKCGKIFHNRDKLTLHLNRHNRARLSYECDLCTNKYNSQTSLTLHKQVKHYVNGRIRLCQICGYQTHFASTFTNHLRRHNKQYRFVCWVCDKKFITKVERKMHMLNKH